MSESVIMPDLQKKKILLLSPNFFDYRLKIKKELENLGAKVFDFDERPGNSFFVKSLLRLGIKFPLRRKIKKYYNSILIKFEGTKLDYLFLVDTEVIGSYEIKRIRKLHKGIKVYTYMWDSFENKKGSKKLVLASDRFFTFDPDDAKLDSRVKFLPLFYDRSYEAISFDTCVFKYDASFIGTIHSDRYRIVKLISKTNIRVFSYFYSSNKILFKLQKTFLKQIRNVNPDEINFQPIKNEDLLSVIKMSRALIDVEHNMQKGLTMRTMEALGARRKLITTNQDIKNYDFYSSNNICIINRKSPNIPQDFFTKEYKDVDYGIYKKYSINNWLRRIFISD